MESFLRTGRLRRGTDNSSSSTVPSAIAGARRPTPWVEKYRPRTLLDVVEQADVVEVLHKCMTGADLPNLLFYGPPGTGKTSTILAAASQLFGDISKERILELNASDERGIQVIRDKVKSFARLTASGVRRDGQPCPTYKIVILDEADSMTKAAQAALRRTMERECRTTRFCLICNYVSRIIQPLTSRCTKFRFKPIGDGVIRDRLVHICGQEELSVSEDSLEAMVRMSMGDMRKAITCLQSCTRFKHGGEEIKVEDVVEVAGVVPDSYISQLLEQCRLKNYDLIEQVCKELMKNAYPISQVMDQLVEEVIYSQDFTEGQKMLICEQGSVCSFRVQDFANEYVELLDLCGSLIQ